MFRPQPVEQKPQTMVVVASGQAAPAPDPGRIFRGHARVLRSAAQSKLEARATLAEVRAATSGVSTAATPRSSYASRHARRGHGGKEAEPLNHVSSDQGRQRHARGHRHDRFTRHQGQRRGKNPQNRQCQSRRAKPRQESANGLFRTMNRTRRVTARSPTTPRFPRQNRRPNRD